MHCRCLLSMICISAVAGLSSCSSYPGQGRTSFEALAQAYREAHESKDMNALLSLVELGDGPVVAVNRQVCRRSFEYDLRADIKRISRKRLGPEDRQRWEHATLKPLGLMEIEWVPEDETVKYSATSRCFGRRDGVYYIVAMGPGDVEAGLKGVSQGTGLLRQSSPEIKRRSLRAMDNWRNDQIDGEPVLLWAVLSQPVKSSPVLGLNLFDEDLDVLGVGIEESWSDANGLGQSRCEEYPVFAHYQQGPSILTLRLVPVQTRQNDQQKDAQQWDEYLKGDGLDVSALVSRDYWMKTLPPAWVSVPEPKGVSVRVYVYDRAGHKSEPVELMSRLRPTRSSPDKR